MWREACPPSSSAPSCQATLHLRHGHPHLLSEKLHWMASQPILPAGEGVHLCGEGLHSHSWLIITHAMSIPPCHSSGISSHKHCLLWSSSRAEAFWEGPQVHLLMKPGSGEGKTGVQVWGWGLGWGQSGPSHPLQDVFSWLHHAHGSL